MKRTAPRSLSNSAAAELADNESAPWHDPSLPLSERMAMAAGKPLALRMMAAMAQQDCGRCGYDCAGYANALFLKEEERLTLCEAGGKETMRVLKELVAEVGANARRASDRRQAGASRRRSRKPERRGKLRARQNSCRAAASTAPNSLKTTWHIEFDISAGGLDYVVGDSFGVYPKKSSGTGRASDLRARRRSRRDIGGKSLREALISDVSLGAAPDNLSGFFPIWSAASGA